MLLSTDPQAAALRYDKRLVAHKFSKAAAGYLNHAALQQQTGEALLGQLPIRSYQAGVDIGCGPGPFTEALKQRCDTYIGIDLAPQMLLEAKRSHHNGLFCRGDMEQLPFASESFDLMFANLSLQWANQPANLFHELARVSAANGVLAFTVVLPNSMQPLARIVQALDGQPRANRQATLTQYQDWLSEAGWQITFSAPRPLTTRHRDCRGLLDSVKGVGASLSEYPKQGLRGRSWYQKLEQALLQHRDVDENLVLHWNIGIVIAVKAKIGVL